MKILLSVLAVLLLGSLLSPLDFSQEEVPSPIQVDAPSNQPGVILEILEDRTRTGKAFIAPDGTRSLSTGMVGIHYESVLDSGSFDTEVNLTPRRINNGQLDGWIVTDGAFTYALGSPGDKPSDGWVGFGGRRGSHFFEFRLSQVGYLHGPTRVFDDVGGVPTYDRSKLTRATERTTWRDGSETVIATIGTWTELWTTPGGGSLNVSWTATGDGIKEIITINQAARAWIASNRPPTTPASETWFGFQLEVDWNDIPKVVRASVIQDINGDFADDGEDIEFRDAQDRLLGLLPIDGVTVPTGEEASLRKRFYQSGGSHFLALGVRVDNLNALPPGDLNFDPTISAIVGAGADDTDTEGGTWSNSRIRPDVPGFDGSVRDASFRWTGINIPQGATILSANFTPHTFPSGDDGVGVKSNIYLEDADNPTAPTSLGDFNGRTRTTAFTAWDDQSFSDAKTTSPDITSAVQEVIDRAGFSSGNSVQIFWDDDGSTPPDHHYEVRTYDSGPTRGADFDVEFLSPGPPPRFGVFTDAACNTISIATDPDCWSVTSGGAGGATVPNATTNVFLDSNTGGPADFGEIRNADMAVLNWNWTSYLGSLSVRSQQTLTVHGNWTQENGTLNIDDPDSTLLVLGNLTASNQAVLLIDDLRDTLSVLGDFTVVDSTVALDDNGFEGFINVSGNFTSASTNQTDGNWGNSTFSFNGTDQFIGGTGILLFGDVNLTGGNKTFTDSFTSRTLNSTGTLTASFSAGITWTTTATTMNGFSGPTRLRSTTPGSPWSIQPPSPGPVLVAVGFDFQDANITDPILGRFINARDSSNVDSGNNIYVSFDGVAPNTFLDVQWFQRDAGQFYHFLNHSQGQTQIPTIDTIGAEESTITRVTTFSQSFVSMEMCVSEETDNVSFTFRGLAPFTFYTLSQSGVDKINASTNGAGIFTGFIKDNWDPFLSGNQCGSTTVNLTANLFGPTVITLQTDFVNRESAVLRGEVTFAGSPPVCPCNVSFEWGFSPALGFNTTPESRTNASVVDDFSATLLELEPGAVLYYRIILVNDTGVQFNGTILTLTLRGPGLTSIEITLLVWLVLLVLLFIAGPVFNFAPLWIIAGVVGLVFGLWLFLTADTGDLQLMFVVMGIGGFLLVGGTVLTIRQGLGKGGFR